ncbi:probable serine/threonine-protein kinase CCRP1 [Aplysia californica]|uniref:Probable serine/threonine-protein kinase CCRP1 n=1 Tax=Aplysia californica TaxID=6500 RepID=A0ABM0K6J1_APLCA|nr:probable serine/threonine-protein kinase CCRP1 [Aplysia californica]
MLSLRPPVFEIHSNCLTEALSVSKNQLLGSGGSSQVYLVTDVNNPDNKKALKILSSLDDEDSEDEDNKLFLFETEVKILQDVRHPNIIRMERAVKCQDGVAILLEYHRSDLFHSLRKLSLMESFRFFIQLIDTVSFLHQHRLVHGDLKLGNVFISHCGNAVLGDFGQAQHLPEHSTSSERWGGSRPYRGPEFIKDATVEDVFKLESYSLGLCLWALLLRVHPEPGMDFLQKLKDAVSIPEVRRKCVERLLCPSPVDRATVVETQQLLIDHNLTEPCDPNAADRPRHSQIRHRYRNQAMKTVARPWKLKTVN